MRQIFNKLRHQLGLNLIKLLGKLLGKINLYTAKRAIALKYKSVNLLNLEVRYIDEKIPQIGEDQTTDQAIKKIVLDLINDSELKRKSNLSLDAKTRNLILELKQNNTNNLNITDAIYSYYMADAFFYNMLKDIKKEKLALNKANAIFKNSKLWTYKELEENFKKINKRFKKLRSELAERGVIKFTFDLKQISSLLGILSFVLSISGYLYVSAFFNNFGINSSLYFSLSDYLPYSLNQIRSIFFATLVNMAFLTMGLRASSLRSKNQHSFDRKTYEKIDLIIFSVMGFAVIKEVFSYYNTKIINFETIKLFLWLLSLIISSWIASKFFKQFVSTFLFIAFSCQIFSSAYIEALINSEKIKKGEYVFRDNIKIKNHENIDLIDTKLFALNSSYAFLFNNKTKEIYIFPKSDVEEIQIN